MGFRFQDPLWMLLLIPVVALGLWSLWRGRRVAVLVDGERMAGEFVKNWDGRDQTGREVGSGIYFARLVAGDFTATRKMLLLR